MDFQISAAQRELMAATEKLCRQLLPLAKDAHAQGTPEALNRLRREMAKNGLLGLNLPQEFGGLAMPLLDTLLLLQTVQCIDSTMGGLTHRTSTGAVGAILELGTAEQKERFVGGVARGEIGISIGITEPEAGSAATAMKTRARIDGDEVVINGQKIFISAARDNHATLLYCRFGKTGRAADIGALVLPHDAPGLDDAQRHAQHGRRAAVRAFFDECRVPRTERARRGQCVRQADQRLQRRAPGQHRAHAGFGAGLVRIRAELRQGAPSVRPRSRRLPGPAVDAGRDEGQARSRAAADLARRGQHGQACRRRWRRRSQRSTWPRRQRRSATTRSSCSAATAT